MPEVIYNQWADYLIVRYSINRYGGFKRLNEIRFWQIKWCLGLADFDFSFDSLN